MKKELVLTYLREHRDAAWKEDRERRESLLLGGIPMNARSEATRLAEVSRQERDALCRVYDFCVLNLPDDVT